MIYIILIAVSFMAGALCSKRVSPALKKAEKAVLDFFAKRLDDINGH